MSLPKVRKKPTIKEIAGVVIELNHKIQYLSDSLNKLDNVLGYYIQMNKDLEKFDKYLNKLREEHDKKTNDSPDNSNLPGDTDGEGSRSERIRKKK